MDWCKIKSWEFKFQLNEFGNFLNNRLRARCTALENTRQCRNTDAYSLVPIRRPKMSCQLRGEEYNEQRTAGCEIQPVRTLAKRNQGNDGVDRGQSTEKEFSGVRMTPVHGRKACFLSGSDSLECPSPVASYMPSSRNDAEPSRRKTAQQLFRPGALRDCDTILGRDDILCTYS